jgi:hypothetical protein
MPSYLSPGVYSRIVEIPQLESSTGPVRPAFIGTAKKGPIGRPVFVSNPQQFIDTFGEPIEESYLGFAALAYFEEGNQAFIMRVAIEDADNLDESVRRIAVDTSGAKTTGWGRIPLFTGIDVGRVRLRSIGTGLTGDFAPLSFQDSDIGNVDFVDANVVGSGASATISFTGTYTGDIEDSFSLIILSDRDISSGSPLEGCSYQIIRNSDGSVVAAGVLQDPLTNGESDSISVTGSGFDLVVEVTSGFLSVGDIFSWGVTPDNRSFTVAVEGNNSPNTYTMPIATYSNIDSFLSAVNALISGENYIFSKNIDQNGIEFVELQTVAEGQRIQLLGTSAFAISMGSSQYAFDIPRANLIGLNSGPYSLSSNNNRAVFNVIGETETKQISLSLPVGNSVTVPAIVSVINTAGTVGSIQYFEAIELTVPGGTTHVAIITSSTRQFDTLELVANFSNLKVLRFADELNILSPYRKQHRGYNDSRVVIPALGNIDPSNPLSCEINQFSAQCISDSNYFQNLVGYFVAPSAGTWSSDLRVELSLFTETFGEIAGRYKIVVYGRQGEILERIEDVSFDKRSPRYVANILNPGSSIGGPLGNAYINWEDRPAFLNNDENTSFYEVRKPSQFFGKRYVGGTNGIPDDPQYSGLLDSAVIGNPQLASGLYAFENPETLDIDLLATPGFSSGSVIGTALQIASRRGDTVYLVDPPFGLRPQQAVDWHNGMLTSDLQSAINTSYGGLYGGWLLINNQFTGRNIWVPPSGHVAAVFSRSAREGQPWSSPAGLRRGRILSPIAVEYSPTAGERDLLQGSGNSFNPILNFTRDGLTIYGNRTLQRGDSPLSRMDVRLLVNNVRKNVVNTLRNYNFEPNDSILWSQIQGSLVPFLDDIQTRRGLNRYVLIVDENTNTPTRIDRGELWIALLLVPNRSAEVIVLNIGVNSQSLVLTSEEILAAIG